VCRQPGTWRRSALFDLHDALGRVDLCFPRDLDGLWLCWARDAECIVMGPETRTRYSVVFVYGLANHFPIIAKRAPCARLKTIMLGLHRITVDPGLISVMFDRVVSSGDNSLVYSSPTVQTDFRRETMGVSSACVVYVSPGGEISVSRVCWEDRVWDATLHPETRKPPEILPIGAEFPGGVLNEDPDTEDPDRWMWWRCRSARDALCPGTG